MKDRAKIIFGLLCASVIVLTLMFWLTGKFVEGICNNHIKKEILSPDNALKAIIFDHNCGATTGFSTQVSVLGKVELLPNQRGNLFIADTDHGKAPSAPDGGPEVKVEWIGARSLRISHHKDARVFHAAKEAHGVVIDYVVTDKLD